MPSNEFVHPELIKQLQTITRSRRQSDLLCMINRFSFRDPVITFNRHAKLNRADMAAAFAPIEQGEPNVRGLNTTRIGVLIRFARSVLGEDLGRYDVQFRPSLNLRRLPYKEQLVICRELFRYVRQDPVSATGGIDYLLSKDCPPDVRELIDKGVYWEDLHPRLAENGYGPPPESNPASDGRYAEEAARMTQLQVANFGLWANPEIDDLRTLEAVGESIRGFVLLAHQSRDCPAEWFLHESAAEIAAAHDHRIETAMRSEMRKLRERSDVIAKIERCRKPDSIAYRESLLPYMEASEAYHLEIADLFRECKKFTHNEEKVGAAAAAMHRISTENWLKG